MFTLVRPLCRRLCPLRHMRTLRTLRIWRLFRSMRLLRPFRARRLLRPLRSFRLVRPLRSLRPRRPVHIIVLSAPRHSSLRQRRDRKSPCSDEPLFGGRYRWRRMQVGHSGATSNIEQFFCK